MDKLRAIEYFNRAAEAGSFAAAARMLGVSAAAVTQLVGALERSIGFNLFNRSTHGLTLTPDGERYYEISRKLAAELHAAEQRLSPRGSKLHGTLTVGMGASIGSNLFMPRIARFLARFPDVELIVKPIGTIGDMHKQNVDVAVLAGWPPARDFVVRPLAQQRLVVCAAPEYWRQAGQPREPEDLRRHRCLIYSNITGTLLDRWTFEKGSDRRVVDVGCHLISYDRCWLEEAACAGAGVVRIGDLTIGRYLMSGALVPVLTDWKVLEAPIVFALYPPHQRHSRRVRGKRSFNRAPCSQQRSVSAVYAAGKAMRHGSSAA